MAAILLASVKDGEIQRVGFRETLDEGDSSVAAREQIDAGYDTWAVISETSMWVTVNGDGGAQHTFLCVPAYPLLVQAVAGQNVSVVAAGNGAGEEIDVFDGVLTGDDANPGFQFRTVVTLTEAIGTHIGVTMVPAVSSGIPLTCTHVGIGLWDGTLYTGVYTVPNMTDVPIEMLWGGNPGFVDATAPTKSDMIPSGYLEGTPAGERLVVSFVTGATGHAGQRYGDDPNAETFFKDAPEAWNVPSVQSPVSYGYNQAGGDGFKRNYNVGAVHTQGEGAASTPPGEYVPPEASYVPLAFEDAIFNGATEYATRKNLLPGQDLTRASIVENGDDWSLFCPGSGTGNDITLTRIKSRECVRLTGGRVTIDQCYLEAKALPGVGDHADVIQAYSPGDTIDFTISNSTVRAYTEDATAGIFFADDIAGIIRVINTVFHSGPYGLRLHADGGPGRDLEVRLSGVYFVGPFLYEMFLISAFNGSEINCTQWEDVYEAEIVDGVLVVGDPIPNPFA